MNEIKFIVDNNIGKLVKLLRIIGFDTKEISEHDHEQIKKTGLQENRIVLTRDNIVIKEIKKAKLDISFLLIKGKSSDDQLMEVINKLDLAITIDNFFSRCTICNTKIVPKKKEEVKGKVPDHAYQVQDEFWYCPDCGKTYWAGTHWSRIMKRLIKLLKK